MDRKTCEVAEGILTPCPVLETAIDGNYTSRRKGVTLIELVNMETSAVTRSGVVLRSGNLGKNGVLLNYCPFCGTPIGDHFKPGEAEALPVPEQV